MTELKPIESRVESVTADDTSRAKEANASFAQHVEFQPPEDPLHEEITDGYHPTSEAFLAILALGFAYSTQNAQTFASTTIAYQVAAIGGTKEQSWVANSYTLALVVTQIALIYRPILFRYSFMLSVFRYQLFLNYVQQGTTGDHFGKRSLILSGLVLGVVAGLISGRANGIYQLLIGQGLGGFGGSLVYLTLPAVQEIVSNRARVLMTGSLFAWIFGIAAITALGDGAAIKFGATGANNGWRFSYYIPVMFCGLAFLCVYFTYHPPPPRMRQGKTVRQILLEIDYIGICLVFGGLMALVLGLNWGGNEYAWSNSRVIVSLAVGVVLILVFSLWEWKGTSTGVLQHRLFINRHLALLLLVQFVDGIIFIGNQAYLPQEVATLFTDNPVLSVTPIIVSAVAVAIGSNGTAYALYRWKRFRITLILGLLWLAICMGIATLFWPGRSWLLYIAPFLWGFGLGVTSSVPTALASLSVPSDLIGTSITVTNTSRNLGVIGVILFSTISNNKLKEYLFKYISPAAEKAGIASEVIPTLITLFQSGAAESDIITATNITSDTYDVCDLAYKQAYSKSFSFIYIAIIPFCIAAALSIFFIKPVADRMTSHVESKLETPALKGDEEL